MRIALVVLAGCAQPQSHCDLMCETNVTLSAHATAAPTDLDGDKMTLCMNNACGRRQ